MNRLSCRPELDHEFIFKKSLFVSFLVCHYGFAKFRAISFTKSSFPPSIFCSKPIYPFSRKLKLLVFLLLPSSFLSCLSFLLSVLYLKFNMYLLLTQMICTVKCVSMPNHSWFSANLKSIRPYFIKKRVSAIIFLGGPLATNQGTHAHTI